MRQGIITVLLCSIGLFCVAAGSKAKGYIVTFHLEGDETESDKFVTPVKLGSEHRQYFFRKMPAFSDKDIMWFYPFIAEDGQSFGAAFRLIDHKAQELTALTVANQGKLLGTRVLDAPLRAVIIDQPINDGVVVIWSGLSQNHLKAIGSKIAHVDKMQGTMSTPSFDLPGSPSGQTSSGSGQEKRKPFKLFGNGFLKKGDPAPVNPYANSPE
ncbi:MAG: hypothetical protein P1V20_28220 [Verrucomicrobiales bacterium]|nr:hypothetical protein [Verrucomicrobiales bacterium]